MTRLILVGAGASHGSLDATPMWPPMGKELFPALEALGGLAATLPEEIKEKFRSRFEEGMDAFVTYSNGNTMRFQRDLAH